MPERIPCPDPACAAPAQIVDRWTFESTAGPIEQVKTRCAHGHWFTPTVDTLAIQPAARPLAASAASAWHAAPQKEVRMRLPVPTRRAALVGSGVLTAAAVGAALLFSVGGIATAAGSSASGATTAPPPDPVVTPVAAALVPGPVKVIRRGESNVLTARIDFRPGASTGWHYHPGPVFVQVVAGSVTLSHAAHGRCLSQVVPAGQGFFEKPGAVHVADNRGKAPAAVYATFVLPPGAPPSVATPIPAPCH